MHLQGLLHKLFDDAANFIDKRIHTLLLKSAETLPDSSHLSLTSIGRSLVSATTVKHNIKRLDRLFSNKTLHKKSSIYFEVMAKHILNDNKQPTILIDWSGLTPCGEFHMLSANICVGGRALPILTIAYRESEYGKQKTHRNFLLQLSLILPTEQFNAKQIIDIYKSRMQIEEYFRDLKNTKNGFGLRHCRSFQKNRLNVALLIGAISTLMLWIIGLMAIEKKIHFSFQSNTLKNRKVLSVFSIGWQTLKQRYLSFKQRDIEWAIREITLCAAI